MSNLKSIDPTPLAFLPLALVYPLAMIGFTHLLWQFSFVMLLALSIILTGILYRWHTTWFVVAGLIIAVLAASNHWLMLPLLLAQVGLTTIVATQKLSETYQIIGILLIAAFVQIAFMMNQTAIINHTFIIDVALQMTPFIVAIIAQKQPVWLTGGIVLVLIAGGYFLQRFTIVTALVCMILALLPSLLKRLPAAYYPSAATLLSITMYLTMLHG